MSSQRTVDANMPHEIDPKVLDDLLNENPATLLRKGDSKLQTLAQFLLRYVILCKPKELLANELHCNQAKAYEEDRATEKQRQVRLCFGLLFSCNTSCNGMDAV
jgi:hypothetical protein